MDEDDGNRLLVEGGPVHRHVRLVLTVLCGWAIGATIGIGGIAIVALKALHEQKESRARATRVACEEANEHAAHRHSVAKGGIEALAASSTRGRKLTKTQRLQQRAAVEAFVEALTPVAEYAVGRGSLRQMELAGTLVAAERRACSLRVRQLTKT